MLDYVITILLFSYCSGDRIEKMTWDPKIRTEQLTKTTIVMLGQSMNRFDNLETILSQYVTMGNVLDKIVLVWNPEDIPPYIQKGSVPIEHYYRKYSLNNRYDVIPYNIITPSVLTVDNYVWLEESLIRDMIETQTQNEIRLVGLEVRSVKNGTYRFSDQATMWNVKFGEWYTDDEFIQKSNDNPEHVGCDSIAMNALIRSHTGEYAMTVLAKKRLHELSFIGELTMQRSNCIKLYNRHFDIYRWS